MQLKVPCPNCGKRARYTEAEAGLPGVCHACGTRFTFPVAAAEVPLADIPVATPLPDAGGRLKPWVIAALIGGILIGVVVGVVTAIILTRQHKSDEASTNSADTKPSIPPVASNASVLKVPPDVSSNTGEHADLTPATSPVGDSVPSDNGLPPGAVASASPLAHQTFIPDRGTPATPSPTTKVSFGSSTRPPIHPLPEAADTLTDARIGKAITDGVAYLTAHLDDKTHELKQNRTEFMEFAGKRPDAGAFYGGLDALCVYSLLQSGQAISDNRLGIKSPYMIGLLEQLKKLPDQLGPTVYARAIRSTALTLFNRPEDKAAIKIDLEWLLKAGQNGAYTYDKIESGPGGPGRYPPGGFSGWDNSNSQYGALGVWSAAEAGYEVPLPYWKQVEEHWTKNQMPNGQWGYETPGGGDGRLSMTAAGVATLFVTHDYLVAPRFGNEVGRDPFSPALTKGLNWLEQSNHAVDTQNSQIWGYTLYGIERAGLASGFKYFGTHDWYREIAREIIAEEHADGSWGRQELIETPYVLLFLARGRHPILMNKLRFDGSWSNRPRDLANLARYASTEMEQPVNWQVVPITHDWTDWTDCPILYMASHKAPTLTDEEYDKIRSFIQSGGLLFTQSDGESAEFERFVGEMSKKLFPNYPLIDLPQDHPIYSVLYHMQTKPKLKVVSNGARLLIVHSPADLARAWQLRQQKSQKVPFDLALNLFQYASGKHELRNRLVTNIITATKATPSLTINVARVQYPGNWDPEPYAWTRFPIWFQRQTGYGANVINVNMSELTPQAAPVAVLTGTDAYPPKQAEIDAIKKYVESGGVLFVDTTGGLGGFEESVRTKLFPVAFPGFNPRPLLFDHPLLNIGAPGMQDLTHPRLRAFVLEKLGGSSNTNEFPNAFIAGRGHVIFTSFDMTCGLLGTNTWGILGYDPDYSQAFIKNLLLWTTDGQKDD